MLRPRYHSAPLMSIGVVAACLACACSGKPGADSLRESFVNQLRANTFVRNYERTGDDLRFSGPGANGEDAVKWRIHIDSAAVEENADAAHPYRGIVKSSWFANEQRVLPRLRESNLPIQLTSNGLAQECWALWDKASARWSWE
jgi:hypothetical protein